MPFRFLTPLLAVALILGQASPTLAQSASRARLLVSPSPSFFGQAVGLTAEVDGLGGGAPTGLVTFADGATTLGAAGLVAPGAGQATLKASHADHACALTNFGGVKCWGYNGFGQIGDGTTTDRRLPTNVAGLGTGVVAIAAGAFHTCAVTNVGGVKCWGNNFHGQLGDGTTIYRRTPVNVAGLTSGVVAITTGDFHTCALTTLGAVRCWGWNQYSQLGDGSAVNRLVPTQVVGLTSGVAAVGAGSYHSCALTNSGAVRCWGRNQLGQLGDGTTTTRVLPTPVFGLASGVAAISVADAHTCAVTAVGGARCWGWNVFGQLGDRTNIDRATPVPVWGLSSGVLAIDAGTWHSCALTTAGAKCWGRNNVGQLGDGTTSNRATPVAVFGGASGIVAISAGQDNSCFLIRMGALRCWGDNAFGQLGDGTTTNRATPTPTLSLTGLVRARARLSTTALARGLRTLRGSFAGNATHRAAAAAAKHMVN